MTKAPILTDIGQSYLIRALAGAQIVFTKMKIGNGTLGSGTGHNLTDLINPLVTIGISDIDTSEDNFVKVTARFDSTDIPSDLRWKELGLFVAMGETEAFSGDGANKTFTVADQPSAVSAVKVDDSYTSFTYNALTGIVTLEEAPSAGLDNVVVVYPTGAEYLYAYSNDGDNAGLLKPNTGDVLSEQTINLVIAVGDAESVTAIISDSVLYASKIVLDEHIANTQNPHSVTKAQIGLGNVPNVSTNNQTPTFTEAALLTNISSGEKISTMFGKIKKAISSLASHINNKTNPHEVTRSQLGAAAAQHYHSASDITGGTIGISRGGTGASTRDSAQKALGIYRGYFNITAVTGDMAEKRITFPANTFTSDDVVVFVIPKFYCYSGSEYFYSVTFANRSYFDFALYVESLSPGALPFDFIAIGI